jgi:hypothetical protein
LYLAAPVTPQESPQFLGDTAARSHRPVGRSTAIAGAATAVAAYALARPKAVFAAGPFDGYVHDEDGQVHDVKNPTYGAKGDTVRKTGGSIASGTTTFTASAATFAAGDVGKIITVQGAGASGGVLSAAISAYTSSTQVALSTAAGTTVSGADFAFGTDDTSAILAAVTAAGARGTICAPAGTYLIRGSQNGNAPITLASAGGLIGTGGTDGTTFLCADATAGIVSAAAATYQGFRCDGNGIATTPLQNGTVVSGSSTTSGSRSMFVDVWATRSAGTGWTIYGAQGSSYYACGATDNAVDGLYVDGGAGGLVFWNWTESASRRYGIRADAAVTGGTGTRGSKTEGIRFFGGRVSSASGDPSGTSKVYLRGASDWKFLDTRIIGDNLTSHTVDLDQSAGATLDFTGCKLSATAGGSRACIAVNGTPPGGASHIPFAITDRARFVAGDTSVYLAAVGNYWYSALDWVVDLTTNGPTVGTGVNDPDTLLAGRLGAWKSAGSLSSPWSGSASYRMDTIGHVELKGTLASSSGSGGKIFTLPAGFRPLAAIQVAVALSTGPASVTVATNGDVTGSAPGTGVSFYLDAVRFPVD